MVQTICLTYVEYSAWTDINRKECHHKKKQIMDDVNDDELVLSSSRVVLEVNGRGKIFYKTMRDIVERTYRCTLHLQHKNQFNESKNQAISKLQETFPKQ